MSQALEDVVVLDLTKQFCASLAAAFLGDFGARVIRLEPMPINSGDAGQWNCEADLAHRNKESLALDMTCERGRALLHELVGKSDVIITDWSRSELDVMGLDYAGATTTRAAAHLYRRRGDARYRDACVRRRHRAVASTGIG